MVDQTIKEFVERVVECHQGCIHSILYCPPPFAKKTVVFIVKDEIEFLPDFVAEIYNCHPSGARIYCFRLRELFELSLPDEPTQPSHFGLWLKYKGTVLYGQDMRDQIQLPMEPKRLLENYLDSCIFFDRNHWILTHLMKGDHHPLIHRMDERMRYLMALALLIRGEHDVEWEALPDRFIHVYSDSQAKRIWEAFCPFLKMMGDEKYHISRSNIFEAVWLFESFIRALRRYTQ